MSVSSCAVSTSYLVFAGVVAEPDVIQLRSVSLHLIIYSLRCRTAAWLSSLQLVFGFSLHLACSNKTVSILKALSFNHAVTLHKVYGRCNYSLNKNQPDKIQTEIRYLRATSLNSTFIKWRRLLLSFTESNLTCWLK